MNAWKENWDAHLGRTTNATVSAKTVRRVLRAAKLADAVDCIRSDRDTSRIHLAWDTDAETFARVLRALREEWPGHDYDLFHTDTIYVDRYYDGTGVVRRLA